MELALIKNFHNRSLHRKLIAGPFVPKLNVLNHSVTDPQNLKIYHWAFPEIIRTSRLPVENNGIPRGACILKIRKILQGMGFENNGIPGEPEF